MTCLVAVELLQYSGHNLLARTMFAGLHCGIASAATFLMTTDMLRLERCKKCAGILKIVFMQLAKPAMCKVVYMSLHHASTRFSETALFALGNQLDT